MAVTPEMLAKLKKEVPIKWRVQSYSQYKPQACCVAYVDARIVMDILDEAVGPDNWQDEYKMLNNQLMAGIGILCGDKWVWKWDTGTESDIEKEKGLISDAFKRAAIKWGVCRFVYAEPMRYVKASEKKENGKYPHPVDNSNKRIYDLDKHFAKAPGTYTKEDAEIDKSYTLERFENKVDSLITEGKTIGELEKWYEDNKSKYTGISKVDKGKAVKHLKDNIKDMKEEIQKEQSKSGDNAEAKDVLCNGTVVSEENCNGCPNRPSCEKYKELTK